MSPSSASPQSLVALLRTSPLAELHRGEPPSQAAIADLRAAGDAAASRVSSLTPERRAAALALCLASHHAWNAAHELCQQHEDTAPCDMVHGILHRLEGDFANARYWFNEAGRYGALRRIAVALRADTRCAPALAAFGKLIVDGAYQPAAMCNAVESTGTGGDPALRESLRAVQAVEWTSLLQHLLAGEIEPAANEQGSGASAR